MPISVSEQQIKQWLEMETIDSFYPLLANASAGVRNDTAAASGAVHGLAFERELYEELLEEFRSKLFTHRETRSIVLICLYVPVFVIAFFGNLLVLMVILPNRRMRSVTNCFIVNMAVSDLLGEWYRVC